MPKDDESVTRDFTVSREFLDSVRAVLPACYVCNKPSGYKDLEGRWSHQICAGETSEEKREAKQAMIRTRGRNVASDAGPLDLAVVMREAAERSAGPRAVADQETGDFESRREADLRHIRSVSYSKPARKSPELISRMSERDVYDLNRVRTDPMDRGALRGELIDRARRAVDLGKFPTAGRDQEAAQQHIDQLLCRDDSESWNGSEVARRVLMTGAPAYQRAFCKVMLSQYRGSVILLSDEEKRAINAVQAERAMAVGVGSTGGFAVPFAVDPTLTGTSSGSRNPFRQICRVETISGTNEWRSVTSGAFTAAYQTEASVSTDASPTLAQPPYIVKGARAFAPISMELEQDWTAILGQLGALVQSAKDDLEAVKFSVGSGTQEPEGLVVGAINTVNGAAGAIAVADLYATETALPARFRPAAQWLGNRAQLQRVRQLPLPESSAPVFEHFAGGPTEIIGYLANEDSGMVSTVTAGSKVLALGDPSYYVIVDRVGMDLEVTTQLTQQVTAGAGFGLPTGQKGVMAFWRNHAKLIDANAFRVLTPT
jgi:HK97 family phage major capsid protein